jgi:hypothetical protein
MWVIKEIIIVGRVTRMDKTNVNNVLILTSGGKRQFGGLRRVKVSRSKAIP